MKVSTPDKRVYATILPSLALATVACSLFFSSGCMSVYAERLSTLRSEYYSGNLETAQKSVEKYQKNPIRGDRQVMTLNAATLALCSGDVATAKENLRQVRDSFDELEQKRVQKSAESLLTYWSDDNLKEYEGEDYEKIMIRAWLAIADLLDGGEDAKAYAYQIAAKQDEIVRGGVIEDPGDKEKKINPKKAYPRIPLGPYLEGLLWEETYVDAKEAARCYEKVVKWRPDFKQAKEDLQRAQTSVHSQPGNGRVYVFAMIGRGPHKEQTYSEATQAALLIADLIFSATNKYSVPPTLAPVPIPELIIEEPRVDGIEVDVDGERSTQTETLADVNEMAIRQYEATKDQIIARAVVRRVVKKGTMYAAKTVGDVNSWVSLAMDVGGVVWEATESADTRCWGVLPAKIQVATFETTSGEHTLTFLPRTREGYQIGTPQKVSVRVPDNRNVYVLINYPDDAPIGEAVVSTKR